LSWLLLFSAAYAGKSETQTYSMNGNYISDWLILGPFHPRDLEKDFLIDSGGESESCPQEGDWLVTESGDTLRWYKHKSKSVIVDLLKIVGNYENATAYAFCTIRSEIDAKVKVLLGSDDGASVWINGKMVHNHEVNRALHLDHDQFHVDLNKGENRCLVKVSQGSLNWGFSLQILADDQPAVIAPRFFFSSNYLDYEILVHSLDWKYKSGDNQAWASPEYDDSEWQVGNTLLDPYDPAANEWRGMGWFRLHLRTDSLVASTPLGLTIWQAGDSEIYLDGKLLYTFGKDEQEWTGLPKAIRFGRNKDHLIAIRYTNNSNAKLHKAGFEAGFRLGFGDINQITEARTQRQKSLIGYQMSFTALTLAIGLLHLILFVFFPKTRQNIYFAFFLFAYAALIYYDYQLSLSVNIKDQLTFARLQRGFYALFVIFQLRFVYELFYKKLPKQFWLILFVTLLIGIYVTNKPMLNFRFYKYLDILIMFEILRIIITAIVEKRDGAWIITAAFFMYYFFGAFDALMDAGVIAPFRQVENPYAIGSIGFFIAMSVYLSRDFARSNKKIAKQELEQELLEAENKRQAQELEAARRLQLSMLPKDLPQLPQLDIAVYMKTATEVGGDYYDFKVHQDGTLTAVIGDATGHGMQAGTMVSATKSLFHALAEEPDPVQFLKKGTAAIKAMGLKGMYMALTIVKFKNHQMQISAAGMPFPLVYHASTGQVEEIVLKGMPLGGFADFPYEDKIIELRSGDVVLLMSDGLEEMFNSQDEMLGAERIKELFSEIGVNHPKEIIGKLKTIGQSWAEDRDQEDDVTFVVIKMT